MPRNNKSQAMLVRARQQQCLNLYAQGKTPDEIALSLHMALEQVTSDIGQATDRLLAHYTCPPHHTFIRYAVFNLNIIRKLQSAVERFEKDKKTVQYNSVISALRAQSDIHDKILDKGLEFGVVERKRASKAARAPADIKAMLKKEILTLSTLLDEVDLSISFHSARRSLALKEERKAYQQSRSYTPIIIKPLIGPYGVIRALPDWKYPKRPYTQRADGKVAAASVHKLTEEQQQHFRVAQEIRQLTTALDGQEPKQAQQQQQQEQPKPDPQQTRAFPPDSPSQQKDNSKGWLVSPRAPQKPPS